MNCTPNNNIIIDGTNTSRITVIILTTNNLGLIKNTMKTVNCESQWNCLQLQIVKKRTIKCTFCNYTKYRWRALLLIIYFQLDYQINKPLDIPVPSDHLERKYHVPCSHPYRVSVMLKQLGYNLGWVTTLTQEVRAGIWKLAMVPVMDCLSSQRTPWDL